MLAAVLSTPTSGAPISLSGSNIHTNILTSKKRHELSRRKTKSEKKTNSLHTQNLSVLSAVMVLKAVFQPASTADILSKTMVSSRS